MHVSISQKLRVVQLLARTSLEKKRKLFNTAPGLYVDLREPNENGNVWRIGSQLEECDSHRGP